jgi:hypothetical protein
MIIGRVVAGMGNGINTIAIPIWQSETAKASHRGKLIVLQLVTNIFGIVITNVRLSQINSPLCRLKQAEFADTHMSVT